MQMYLITTAFSEKVTAPRILHPLSKCQTNIISKQYTTLHKHVIIHISLPEVPTQLVPDPPLHEYQHLGSKSSYNLTNQWLWFDSDNGDEDTCRAELLLPDRRILEVEWLLHDADEDEGGDDQQISGSSENDYYKDYISSGRSSYNDKDQISGGRDDFDNEEAHGFELVHAAWKVK